MAGSKVLVNLADLTGQKAVTGLFFSTIKVGADMAALATALDGVTNAAITSMRITAVDATGGDPAVAGDYDTAEDQLVITLQGMNGLKNTISVPAPMDDIWLPDKETADPSNAAYGDFVTWLNVNAKDPNGNQLTVISGRREKTRRKNG